MKMYEYQAAQLYKDAGIPVPPGEVVTTVEGAKEAFRRTGGRGVIKAQVFSGGRGKAGGVALVETAEAAEEEARRILSLTIGGYPVKTLLVSRALEVQAEFYMGITLDRGEGRGMLILSAEGGVEIETLAAESPEKIMKIPLTLVPEEDEARLSGLDALFSGEAQAAQARVIAGRLIRLFREKDCTLAEINPLALDGEGVLTALDAKVTIDENALFLHPDLAALKEDETPAEGRAREAGISFVGLEGDVGCIVNGAGLAMATMDAIHHFGAVPANFLDVGGSSDPQKMVRALEIITGNPKVRRILINIFGGITRCDDVARGIILAAEKVDIPVPLVIRLTGTNEEEGSRLLTEAGYHVMSDMAEAVRHAVGSGGGQE